jgi:enoyl-CoA hydratase
VGPKRAKELAFVAGNHIDGRTAVEWGWANHAVPEEQLLDTVRALAGRIALVPSEVLALKKLSINRAMEAMGVRQAASSVSEMDALLHLAPSVVALRERIGEEGLKAVMASFKGPSTTEVARAAGESA